MVHLDALYWKPGWVESSKEEWAETIKGVLKRDAWVMDGNYSGTLPERIDACEPYLSGPASNDLSLQSNSAKSNVSKCDTAGYGRWLPRTTVFRILRMDMELSETIAPEGREAAW